MTPEEINAEWLATRPESVQKLAAEFPLQTALTFRGSTWYILGYTEGDCLIVTPIWPAGENYERAIALRQIMHGHCARDAERRDVYESPESPHH